MVEVLVCKLAASRPKSRSFKARKDQCLSSSSHVGGVPSYYSSQLNQTFGCNDVFHLTTKAK